jgi:regulator of sigma E protease
MAIISAGVIMNVILCFVLAMIAYGRGVRHQSPIVGKISPGAPAWQHNIPVGAVITRVGDRENPSYDRDVRRSFALAQRGKAIDLDYTDPRTGKSHRIVIAPKHDQENIGRVGIMSSESLRLLEKRPTQDGSPAAAAGFQGHDTVIAVKVAGSNDALVKVTHYFEFHEFLVQHPDKPLDITVERSAENGSTTTATLTVQPMPMRRVGLVMTMGRITAVQPDSPAAQAGIQPEDVIVGVVDKASGRKLAIDPLTLPDQLRKLSPGSVTLTVRRGNQEISREVTLRQPQWAEDPLGADSSPMSIPAMGVAYQVLNQVAEVLSGSPAAANGQIKPGDTLTSVKLVQPDVEDFEKRSAFVGREITIELGPDKLNWPFAILFNLQMTLPDTTMQLTVEGRKDPIELTPAPSSDWFSASRGLRFEPVTYIEEANSLADVLRLAGRETWDSLTLVVDFLHRIPDLWKHAGGPISIVNFAVATAEAGLTEYLLFLAMLSANLAVINILPIPVLDGGHLMFLIYEGIRRKPPSEKVMIGLNFVGLALILGIMVVVIALDIGRLAG